MFGLLPAELSSMGLLKELWIIISMDNPTTYYKLLQTSKVFKLDTVMMKAKFIRKNTYTDHNKCIIVTYNLPNDWLHSCNDQPAIISKHGQFWYADNKQHRDNDQPASIYANGAQHWYCHGKKHRDINDNCSSATKPAEIYANGDQCWYYHGNLHRDDDQPAQVETDGSQHWYYHGKLHRDNDKPAVIEADGTQSWYIDGKLHRDNDQPAEIDADGTQSWYINGKLHRDINDHCSGAIKPVSIWVDGSQYRYRL